ncbi:toxin Bro, partial [Segatella copri]
MVKSVNTNKVEMDKKAAAAVVFENPEFGKIRTLTDENGEPLFCAKDVCDVLGYKKSRNAVNQLVNPLDALKQGAWVVTGIKKDGTDAKRFQQMIYVSESGFYALVLGSKLSTAVKFKNWVTADVLPQIRKTGGYIPVQQGESDEETIRHAEEILRATLKEKENLLKKQRLQIEQQKKLIGEQDTEIRRLNDVVDEQVVRIAKNGDNIIQLENQVGNLLP